MKGHLMPYQKNFFSELQNSSLAPAELIVPWVIQLISPRSVVDVGCGTGSWLSVFQKHGVQDFLGIDGDWVPSDMLEISTKYFRVMDLRQHCESQRQFDLVVSLEVAEHLPPDVADRFISDRTSLGPVVLFSAAIPGQGGTSHMNEQWPTYWISLFRKKGYKCIDCVRGRFWTNEAVAWYYAQNTFFFVAEDRLNHYPALLKEKTAYSLGNNPIVHPRLYNSKIEAIERLSNPANYSILKFIKVFPIILRRAILWRLKIVLAKLCD